MKDITKDYQDILNKITEMHLLCTVNESLEEIKKSLENKNEKFYQKYVKKSLTFNRET